MIKIIDIDYQVVFMKLPGTIKETVTLNSDGSYTIFIADWLSAEDQRKAFFHAMKHILGKDFELSDVDQIERTAHAKNYMQLSFS